jgi:hypothetical protein
MSSDFDPAKMTPEEMDRWFREHLPTMKSQAREANASLEDEPRLRHFYKREYSKCLSATREILRFLAEAEGLKNLISIFEEIPPDIDGPFSEGVARLKWFYDSKN